MKVLVAHFENVLPASASTVKETATTMSTKGEAQIVLIRRGCTKWQTKPADDDDEPTLW